MKTYQKKFRITRVFVFVLYCIIPFRNWLGYTLVLFNCNISMLYQVCHRIDRNELWVRTCVFNIDMIICKKILFVITTNNWSNIFFIEQYKIQPISFVIFWFDICTLFGHVKLCLDTFMSKPLNSSFKTNLS